MRWKIEECCFSSSGRIVSVFRSLLENMGGGWRGVVRYQCCLGYCNQVVVLFKIST